jgi:hypothetical protein
MKLGFGCVLVLTASAGAQCATASCFGPAGTDPLVISGAWTVASGANLDFGPRHVILAAGASLTLSGPASIAAAKLTGQAGSLIDGTAVGWSDLTITTTPAGLHDGSVTLDGQTNLGIPLGFFLQAGGSFTINAGGPVSVFSLDTSGGEFDAGDVTITAPSITVVGIVANTNHYYATGATVTLTSTGPVTVGSIHALTTVFGASSQVSISGSSYTQTVDVVAAPHPGSGGDYGGSVIVNVTGAATIQGPIKVSEGASVEYGGSISITAGGHLTWTSAQALASGARGGDINLRSLASDVWISGSLVARTEPWTWVDDDGGYVSVEAAGQLDFTGLLDVSSAQATLAWGAPQASLIAGRTLRIHAGSVVQARDLAGGCTAFGGFLSLEGCRILVEPGASVVACGSFPLGGAFVHVAVRDVLTVDGTVSAGGTLPTLTVQSRLPWQFALAGSGTMTPSPVVTVDPALVPCLAESTTVTATSPITAGQPLTLTVTSHPLRSLLVAADLSLVHLPLDAFGWTQVNVLAGFRIADDLGLLGPPIPGATDANGHWSWSIVTPVTPVLSNVDVYFDVYVIDPAALNGLFEQPPYATVHFN